MCPQEPVGGIVRGAVVRWYCSEHLARWKTIYGDLEIDYCEVPVADSGRFTAGAD
jgi:hypothetical protein